MQAKQTIREANWGAGEAIHFGGFCLTPGKRKLERAGQVVRLGDRALDVLLLLVANAPDVVSKAALLTHIWPESEVDEGNLRFQIAMLRRALGEGSSGEKFLATVQGRGYCFVAPVSRIREDLSSPAPGLSERNYKIPRRLPRMMGRDEDISSVRQSLLEQRFVSIVGPGGVGKTTLALAVSHALVDTFGGEIRFIDLGALSEASQLPVTLASLFGLSLHGGDPIPGLVALLGDTRALLVFDCCEHLIDAAAKTAEALFAQAPNLCILATSREPLRAEGEHVYLLQPLPTPPQAEPISVAELLEYPAAKLFVERAAMSGGDIQVREEDCAVIAEICRRLDGIPLAIELAAGRVHAFGIGGLASSLDGPLSPAFIGKRTAPVRHQSIAAMLDWSYGLLTGVEAQIFRHLSIFVGRFSMEAAQIVASHEGIDKECVAEALAGLVAKSLITSTFSGDRVRYRLLDTTRCYARQKLGEAEDLRNAMLALAAYLADALRRADPVTGSIDDIDENEWHRENIGNIRVALEWCCSTEADCCVGLDLVAEAATVFMQMSQWGECSRWTRRAIAHLPPELKGSRTEMQLRESFAIAELIAVGPTVEVLSELRQGLAVAERLGDRYFQLRIISGLFVYHQRSLLLSEAIGFAERAMLIAGAIGDPDTVAQADWMMAVALQTNGRETEAAPYCESARRPYVASRRGYAIGYGNYEHRTKALCALARNLWLRGYCSQAVEQAEWCISSALELERPISICVALTWMIPVFLWQGLVDRAEDAVNLLLERSTRYSMGIYILPAKRLQCEVMLKRHPAMEWVDRLRDSVDNRNDRLNMTLVTHHYALAEGLMRNGRHQEGLRYIELALAAIGASGGHHYCEAEMIRVKAMLLAADGHADPMVVDSWFCQGMALARRKGALSWELRLAISSAEYERSRGDAREALATLKKVYSRFDREQDSQDLRRARKLIAELGEPVRGRLAPGVQWAS